MIRALKNMGSFRGDCSVRTWLYAIAKNVWLEFIRKSRKTVNIEDLLELYIDDSMLDTVSTEMMARLIREQLTEMGQRTQDVVLLRSEGYSYDEIAARLQITASSARVIEYRAKKRLKKVLLKEGFLDE